MKRILRATLALLLIASQVDAKVLVVMPKLLNTAGQESDRDELTSGTRFTEIAKGLLDRVTSGQGDGSFGYKVVRVKDATTEELRLGTRVYNRGKGGATTETFDGEIWIYPSGGSMGAGLPRLDSLLAYSRGGPQVPILILMGDRLDNSTTPIHFESISPVCSTGVNTANNVRSSLPYYNDCAAGSANCANCQHLPGSTKAWFDGSYLLPIVHTGPDPTGGFRRLICTNAAGYVGGSAIPSWRDSAVTYASNDTMQAWELEYNDIHASRAIFFYCDGIGTNQGDSIANALGGGGGVVDRYPPAEVAPAEMLMAYARLDSVIRAEHPTDPTRRLFAPDKLPIRLAATVDGAFMRTTHLPGPGIRPQDSTIVKATLDSIANLNASGGVQIKLTFGVNCDSMTAANYQSELGWLRKLGGNARFSPQGWRGVLNPVTATSGDGNAAVVSSINSFPNIVDALGFRRSRIFMDDGSVFNTGNADDADSSVCTLLKAERQRMVAAGIRPEEMSHTLLPPLDDWSPSNQKGGMDSMLYVCRVCGNFSTIRTMDFGYQSSPWRSINGASMVGSATYRSVANGSFGYMPYEGMYKDAGGGLVKLLTHNYTDILGAYGAAARQDSVGDSYDAVAQLTQSVWKGLSVDRESGDRDYWSVEAQGDYISAGVLNQVDYFNIYKNKWIASQIGDFWPGNAHILALKMSDLSGHNGGIEANASRNGYWALKWIKNQMDAVNTFAGQTIITYSWPEDVRVK